VLIVKQSRDIKTFFLFQTLFFLFFIFVSRGLPTGEAIRVTALIAAQTFVGATTWRFLTKFYAISMFEVLATGFALGSALFTVVDQGLIFFGLTVNDVVTPCLLLLMAFIVGRIQKNAGEISEISQQDLISLLVVSICVFLGFGEFSHGSFIAVAILATTCILIINQHIALLKSAVLSTIGLGMAVFAFFLVKPPIAYGSWFLRPLFTETDDAVFSESVAYSLSIFGPSNYAAAAGTGLRYHWFSLAWSGLVQRSASVSPFGMTLHVVPVVSFLVIAMLLIAIGKRIGLGQRYLFIAPLVLFFASSVPERLYFYSVINTSNVLTFVWSLTFLLVLILHTEKKSRFGQYLLGLTAGIVLLSKMPYAVTLLGGTATSSIYIFLTNRQSRKSIIVQLSVILLFTTFSFLLFLTPNSWEERAYVLDWNLMNIASGSQFRFPIALGLVAIFLFTRFPLLFLRRATWEHNVLKVFIWGAVSTGIIRFIVNGKSAEDYFLNSALVFGSLGLAIAVKEVTPSKDHFRTWQLLGMGSCSGLSSFAIIEIWNRSNFQGGNSWQSNLQIVVPFLVAILTSTGAIILKRKSFGPSPVRLTALLLIYCLIGANAGIYVLQTVRPPEYAPRGSIAADVDLSSLQWLRNNSAPSEWVATNRFLCPGIDPCDFDESSFLISAVANRQVYIEGPRFVAGGRPYPSWITDRISVSRSFAEAPSDQIFNELRESGVSWFYLDTDFLPENIDVASNPWSDWASIELIDLNIIILKLNSR
jgi:hypothetical protein